ncbi:MAG: amidohydrolase [Deltaproteobacteria bacterium]|nr:amidohydrolase [Deltaproteobacteria bacterium]
MIVDVHTHLFFDDVRNNRADYFTGEPAFELLYGSPGSKMAGMEDTIRSMDENKVDVSVVFGFPWENPDTAQKNNDYIIKAVSRYPDRFVGLACVSTFHDSAAAEVARCIDAGLSGVGELAFYRSGIDERAIKSLEPIMDICKSKGLPVLIHTNEPVGHIYPGKTENTLARIYSLVRAWPENKIILAHWGGGIFFYSLLKKEVKGALENVWFDTAASPYLYNPDIYNIAARVAGPEKILFGTDFPLLPPSRYYRELEASGIADGVKKQILGENAAALFGLQERGV